MAYLGNPPAEAYTSTVKDSFNGDASTTAFTLSQPSTTNNLRVVVENVIQDPTVAYSVSGTTLTFTSAPPSGTANIYAVHLGPAMMTAVPPSEITNATTYTSDLTVQGSFTSPGIDDNADATAITIDSSENVLIGKTSADFGVSVGMEMRENDTLYVTRDGGASLNLNRKTSDGNIALFQKDGSTVGRIGSGNSGLGMYISAPNDGGAGLFFNDNAHVIYPTKQVSGTNTLTDDYVNIGASALRFKDLYLSGGVYLGGTGSANYLDDYEEGTFNCSISDGSTTPTQTQYGYYTKIGNMCHIYGQTTITGSSSGGSILRFLLPFSVPSNARGALTVGLNQPISVDTGDIDLHLIVELNTYVCYIVSTAPAGGHTHLTLNNLGTGIFSFSGTFTVA